MSSEEGKDEAPASEPQLSLLQPHKFSRQCMDMVVHFMLLPLKQSLFVWVGTQQADLGNMSLALQDRYAATDSVCLCFVVATRLQTTQHC